MELLSFIRTYGVTIRQTTLVDGKPAKIRVMRGMPLARLKENGIDKYRLSVLVKQGLLETTTWSKKGMPSQKLYMVESHVEPLPTAISPPSNEAEKTEELTSLHRPVENPTFQK